MFNKIIALMLIFILVFTSSVSVLAHPDLLNVVYDDCEVPKGILNIIVEEDGEDEMWYALYNSTMSYHLSHEVDTIKYYFNEFAKDDNTYTWTTDCSLDEVKAIKEAYVNSMKKWNNIYYYSYDEQGNRTANKIINVIEGTKNDHNLTIYPINTERIKSEGDENYYASTGAEPGTWKYIPNSDFDEYSHYHYSEWYMKINIDCFKNNYWNYSKVRERTGAHELGHVLGLQDVDNWCSSADFQNHHEEILMGYGDGNRSTYAKYKDIAGVSITRGFHTDADHVWMLRTNTDGTQDVICAKCNGVRKNIALTNGKYEEKTVNVYKSCVHHGGTNEKMLLVATDGTRDFYKCQYCRYISEVDHSTHYYADAEYIDTSYHFSQCVACNYSNNVPHNTKYSNITDTQHTYGCTDCNYSVTSEHDMRLSVSLASGTKHGQKCVDCGYVDESTVGTHSFTTWVYLNPTTHVSACDGCNARTTTTASHVYTFPDSDGWIICIGCGYTKIFGSDGGFIIMSVTKVSANGSHILSDGTIMLAHEDIEAYLNGTLAFYDKDNVPQTR